MWCCQEGNTGSNGNGGGTQALGARQEQRSRDIVPLDPQTASSYVDNTVINSRYTILNFIFKNLYEQFRRPLNFYFLLVTMLQFISIIAPVNPMSTLLPLLFAFSLTAVKEGYDDVKRHRQDTAYNTTMRVVLDRVSGQWKQTRNSNIRVGDVMLLKQNEEIPCDCLVLAAPSASVFIRTDNLDGEIDLKPRDVLAPRVELAQSYTNSSSPLTPSPPSPAAKKGVVGGSIPATPDTPLENSPTLGNLTFFSLDDTGDALLEKLSCLSLHCPPPNAIVESFDGVADFTVRNLAASPVRLVSPSTFSLGDSDQSNTQATAETVKVSLSHRHLLPQSCLLKNTEKAICLAVYTGNDTKCGMNKRPPPVKWAKIDKDVSKYSVFIFCCQMISALAFGFCGYAQNRHAEAHYWYLPQTPHERAVSILIYPLRFFLLTTVMIPVSFKFVVDMSKYYTAMAVEWDETMVHGELGGCKVRNSSILEDLGQIDYVLSDKTGTMTQNVMELQCISVVPDFQVNLAELPMLQSVFSSPTVSGAMQQQRQQQQRHQQQRGDGGYPSTFSTFSPPHLSLQSAEVHHFACMLSLCNTVEVSAVSPDVSGALGSTVVTFPTAEPVCYQAASPDEVALCCGAVKLSVLLQRRTLHCAVLRIGPNAEGNTRDEEWVLHHVFPFSSERKAMGVIVENKQRKRILFILKGADDSVAKMLKRTYSNSSGGGAGGSDQKLTVQNTWEDAYPAMAQHLRAYARKGLRTLLVAQRTITREQMNEFLNANREAELAMEQRQEKIDALRTALETNLELIGITAIEDKLQEHVQETISDILSAGMRMWMLTGDKVETAEQIGVSCGLYGSHDRVIRVVEGENEDTRDGWRDALLQAELPQAYRRLTRSGSGQGSAEAAVEKQWARLSSHEKEARLARGRRAIQRVRCFGVAAESVEELNTTDSPSPNLRNDDFTLGAGNNNSDDEPASALGNSSNAHSSGRTVLVVQGGRVLESIFATPSLATRFAELSQRCVSVICARTTPSQKAMITQFVRSQDKMTLSIGDGGNDVAMIQEAHVGVGIVGKEGQQAARAADFAVTQFSDLRPLLFVHGQQAYARTAYVIKYSFYKSMLIAFIQLAYNTTGTYLSGGTFWNSFSLTMWNGVYTLPQTLFFCLDRFAPRVVLERCPALYKRTRQSADMDVTEFFGWYVLRGAIQSLALLYFVSGIYGGDFAFPTTGYASSNDINFSVAYTALILSQLVTVFLESHSVTPLNLLWLIGMPVFYLVSTLAFSDIPKLQYYGVLRKTLRVESWLAAVGIAVALTMPVVILSTVREAVKPSGRDVLRVAELKRQRVLLKQRGYRATQSFWTRWFGCTPEAASSSLLLHSSNYGGRPLSMEMTDITVAGTDDGRAASVRVV